MVVSDSPFPEDHSYSGDDQCEAGQIIPPQRLFQVQDREDREHRQGNDFLDRLQLGGGEFVRADAVSGHLETVFEECNHPTDNDNLPECDLAELEVSIPGECHEDVGNREEDDSSHAERGPFE